MIEKVNPMHPDKIADRIAGALLDMVYAQDEKHRYVVNEARQFIELKGGFEKTCGMVTLGRGGVEWK